MGAAISPSLKSLGPAMEGCIFTALNEGQRMEGMAQIDFNTFSISSPAKNAQDLF